MRGGHRGTPVRPDPFPPAAGIRKGHPAVAEAPKGRWARAALPCRGPSGLGPCEESPGQGSPEAGVTGARPAPRRPVDACLWVEERPRNTWVGAGRRLCRHGAGSGAGGGAALPLRPAPLLRCLPGCPSSPELPALPGSLQRCCRAGRTRFVRCSRKVKIMRALGVGWETAWQIRG